MNDSRELRDRGNVLPLVLVLLVISGFVVVPTLTYASTLLRANEVVADGAREIEAARAGARVALAEPFDVFQRCKPGSTYNVSTNINGPSSTVCNQVSEIGLIPTAERHKGTVALQLGETYPNNAIDGLEPPTGALTDWWVSDATAQPTVGKVWTPALPPKPSVISDPAGYPLGAPYNCTVYFPGTFDQPLVIDDRTYFASGVYYFLDTVAIVGGADAVVGMGLFEGCTDDYDVASLIEPIEPLPNGGGGTFVFGGEGKLVITDSVTTDGSGNLVTNTANTPLRFQFNQRYVQETWQPDARVSVMSVNGDIDANPGPPVSPGALDVPNVINMPLSDVATSTSLVSAISQGYVPSTLTPESRPPEVPKNVVLEPLDDKVSGGSRGAIRVSWLPPIGNDEGGSTITQYQVTANPGNHVCTTDGASECLLLDLANGTTFTVTVTATNDKGTSDPSAPQTIRPKNSDPDVVKADRPTNVTVTDPTTYLDDAEISWDAPTLDGNAPIVGYRAEAYAVSTDLAGVIETKESTPAGSCETFSFRLGTPATSCVITGLPPLDGTPGNGPIPLISTWAGYRFEVVTITATSNEGLPTTPLPPGNVVAESDPSPPTNPPVLAFTGATPYVDPNPGPPVWPIAPTYVPDPIIVVDTSGAASAIVEFAGYVSVPQGRIAVARSTDDVQLRGGVMAAAYDVANDVATEPDTTIGFENTTLQRLVELVTISGNARSTMRVQINENGEYAVNSWVIE